MKTLFLIPNYSSLYNHVVDIIMRIYPVLFRPETKKVKSIFCQSVVESPDDRQQGVKRHVVMT